MGDADHRLPLAAEAEGLVGVGGRGTGHRVGLLLGLRLAGQVHAVTLLLLEVEGEGELVVLVPGHLVLAHPERSDLDRVLGAFVLVPLGLVGGRAHHELATGDRHHLELDLGARDGLDVRLHLRSRWRARLLGAAPAKWAKLRPSARAPANRQACDNRLTFGMLHQVRVGSRFSVLMRSGTSSCAGNS